MKSTGKIVGALLMTIAFIAIPTGPISAAENKPTVAAAMKTVTFIELGSVKCIPCKAMQPIMEKVRKELGDQVEVVFYDVWTEAGRPYGGKYRIRVIPTQVFLDRDGKEYFRHEGFFPEAELKKILAQGGVKR